MKLLVIMRPWATERSYSYRRVYRHANKQGMNIPCLGQLTAVPCSVSGGVEQVVRFQQDHGSRGQAEALVGLGVHRDQEPGELVLHEQLLAGAGGESSLASAETRGGCMV